MSAKQVEIKPSSIFFSLASWNIAQFGISPSTASLITHVKEKSE